MDGIMHWQDQPPMNAAVLHTLGKRPFPLPADRTGTPKVLMSSVLSSQMKSSRAELNSLSGLCPFFALAEDGELKVPDLECRRQRHVAPAEQNAAQGARRSSGGARFRNFLVSHVFSLSSAAGRALQFPRFARWPFLLFIDLLDQRTRVMSCTQLVSQVVPLSGEYACSQ